MTTQPQSDLRRLVRAGRGVYLDWLIKNRFSKERTMLLSARKLCTMLISAALLIQCATGLAFGQASSTTGATGGSVVDQSGGVISGATITVRSLDTGLERTVKTEDAGVFRITQLPPGIYELTANAQGFNQLKRTGITVRVGDEVNLKLEVGASGATEVVNVTAEAPVAEPSKTQVSTTINEQAI